jgi:Domain of unknown function (DUF4265)
MNDADIATHEDPAWMQQANFIIVADLGAHGMQGRLEQMWAKQLGETEFILCCIPFFTYGMALGDRVFTSSREDRRYIIEEVRGRSGRRVSRLWLKDVDEAGRVEVKAYISEQRLLSEWYSINLLALDIPEVPEVAEEIRSFLQQFAERWGALVESGDRGT